MKEKRLTLGLTQKQASRRCGISRERWSSLERGYRSPKKAEQRILSALLGLDHCFVAPPEVMRQLRNSALSMAPNHKPFIPHQDRPTFVRFRASSRLYPELTTQLLSLVRTRSDFALCEYVCHKTSCDSSLESLLLLYLLALGAKPGFYAPAHLGRTPHPIVDDRGRQEVDVRTRPCLMIDQKYYFFQVSFSVSRVVRVDVLRWDEGWSVIEIDGSGHDDRLDSWKEQAINLPTMHLTESDLIRIIRNFMSLAS
jgi:transcriptional regulator with XRE-family HTH domain